MASSLSAGTGGASKSSMVRGSCTVRVTLVYCPLPPSAFSQYSRKDDVSRLAEVFLSETVGFGGDQQKTKLVLNSWLIPHDYLGAASYRD